MLTGRGRNRRVRSVPGARVQTGNDGALPLRPMQRLLVAGAFVLLVLAMTRGPRHTTLTVDDINEPVRRGGNIQAQRTFKTTNLRATAMAESKAMDAVPAHYRVAREKVEARRGQLTARIENLVEHRKPAGEAVLKAIAEASPQDSLDQVVNSALLAYVAEAKTRPDWSLDKNLKDADIAVWLRPDLDSLPPLPKPPPPEASGEAPADATIAAPVETPEEPEEPSPATLRYTQADRLAALTVNSLEYVLSEGVLANSLLPRKTNESIVILRSASGDLPVADESMLSDVADVDQAREKLHARLTEASRAAAAELGEGISWAKLQEAALALAEPLVTETLYEDTLATIEARGKAKSAVEPVTYEVPAGKILQEYGKEWTAQSRSEVETYLKLLAREEQPYRALLSELLGKAIIVGLVLLCLRRSTAVFAFDTPEMVGRYFNLSLLVMCAALVTGRVVFYFEPTGFVVPVAATGILLAILTNTRLAAIVSILVTLLVSAQYNYDWRIFFVGTAMSVAGTFGIYKVRRRSDMAAASIKATVAGVLAMCAITFAMDTFAFDTAARRLMLVCFNGTICLLVVPGLLSPLERLFHITTDIQLLEYSDLNNELLSQLAIHAPGSYAHSQFLGQLAEAAADAIGANGLLARVCAYYHDIGKMRRSEYFTENQTGANIHDELTPRLSARAIAAHVTQGAELAREYHLPQPIIDGILEHHGTGLVGFFYQQALDQQKHGGVTEADFRYPGPRPQRPETAILMICDAAESAVRSLKNPNEERVREIVDKIVAARSSDRQFDDCNLTLKQLNTIAEVISKRIVSSLHTRIAYPEMRPETPETSRPLAAGGVE